MAWIEVHQALRDHRKILALADELDMPEPHVAGHCLYLWLWSLDNAPDGVLPSSRRIIARAAAWTGDPDLFVDSLITVGLLDLRDEDGALRIHDWDEYAGKISDRRERNKLAMRAARERDKAERVQHVSNTSTSRDATSKATVPNSTLQNHSGNSSVSSQYLHSANAAKPQSAPPKPRPSMAAILAKVPSSTKQKFSQEDLQKQFDRAMLWVSEEPTRFMTTKFFADWLEREVTQGHIIPENASEVEKIQRILKKTPDEKGIIDGQTVYVWKSRLREAKQLAENQAYEERCRERQALDALYTGDETLLVSDQSSNHKTPT